MPGQTLSVLLRQLDTTWKLAMVDAAVSLEDLRVPPGNRLERLAGDREGHFSIRIDDQWRICFAPRDGDVYEVEIVDYHEPAGSFDGGAAVAGSPRRGPRPRQGELMAATAPSGRAAAPQRARRPRGRILPV